MVSENRQIVQIIKDWNLNPDDGYCAVENDIVLDCNSAFLNHLSLESIKNASIIDFLPESEKNIYLRFKENKEPEDIFLNPHSLIVWTFLKYNNLFIIITNNYFQKIIAENNFSDETFGFNISELLKINDEPTFHNILEVTPDYIVITDIKGTVKFISSNAVERLGYNSKNEIIGNNFIKYVNKDDRKRGIILFANYIINKKIDEDSYIKVQTKNGVSIPVEINLRPFVNHEDKVFILHSLRDVTHRFELEEKLIKSEKAFKNTVPNSPLGIHFYVLAENDELIFAGYNDAADRILGINHNELLNKTIEVAFPGLKDTDVPNIYKNIAKNGDRYYFEQINYKDSKITGAFEVHAYQTYENNMAAIFLDISERKKNEEEIIRLEKEYRNIFDYAPYAIFQTTYDGRFLRINQEGAKMLGYDSPEEITQKIKSIRDEVYYNPEDRDKVVEKLKKANGFITEQVKFKKKTGEPFDTEMIARIVKDETNNSFFLEGFVNDISRRVKAENELKKIYTEQQTIFDSIPAAICYKDTNNNYLRVNQTSAKFLKTKVKNIIGKSASDFFPEHLAKKFYEEDTKVIKTGKSLVGIIDRIEDSEGKTVYLKTDRIPYKDEDGNIVGVISFSNDITQQYEAEEKVRKYLKYLEFLNKTALDLLKLKNLDDIFSYIVKGLNAIIPDILTVVLSFDKQTSSGSIRGLSNNFKEIIKRNPELSGVVNKEFRWVIGDRYINDYRKAKLVKLKDSFANLVQENLSQDIANKIAQKVNINEIYVIGICKDEELFGIVYIFPQKQLTFDYSKHIEAFLYQCALAIDQKIAENKLRLLTYELEDRVKERTKLLQNTLDDLSAEINVRKVIEKELINAKLELTKALEKEKELNELKSRFIDMISHEYRTPLTVILSSMYLIESYSESGDIPKVRKHTDKVKKSVDIMTNLIENVLTIGRGDADKIKVEKRWFEIDRILRDIIDEVLIIDKEQHPINLKFKSEINQVYSDSRLVRQMLTNIILNAVKYSDCQKPVDIEVFNDLDFVTISIRDYGSGIDEEELNHIYDAFFRGKNQIGITSGTGLGLTIVKRFADILKGEIFVESKINKGTTFKIVLPSK